MQTELLGDAYPNLSVHRSSAVWSVGYIAYRPYKSPAALGKIPGCFIQASHWSRNSIVPESTFFTIPICAALLLQLQV